MSKLGVLSTVTPIAAILGALAFATFSSSPAAAADGAPCLHKEFKTELVKQACEKGGQKEAKAAMKTFMTGAKIKSCNVCHSNLAPKYDLKPDGLELFKKAGGK